ncbi:hypothetical protein J2X06_002834 [Lysobacter niastensis]|uniref:Uncharacterized protein n=1 Tax=Lysobacter niastensis TaxID=380629 RepID=A0ABU1WE47_9GAMM|nr:hypothetical protein [Lysobacter niastensis]MDR7135625.1 hypothetical protein [Lysobacter niastensis]
MNANFSGNFVKVEVTGFAASMRNHRSLRLRGSGFGMLMTGATAIQAHDCKRMRSKPNAHVQAGRPNPARHFGIRRRPSTADNGDLCAADLAACPTSRR